MEVVVGADVPEEEQRYAGRPGKTVRQYLLSANAADGLNVNLYRSQYQSGDAAFESPRHHHAFQQIRWTESGTVNYAPGQDIPEGDLAYFPRGAYYGPQRKDQGIGVLLQFGFDAEHQSGAAWSAHREAALERLKSRGRFEHGLYISTDPATGETAERDAVQAIYEEQALERGSGQFTIPPEGYETPILIHPRAFAYYQTAPGVEIKHLGNFYDHPGPNADAGLSMLRLSAVGAYNLGAQRAQVGWTGDPGLQIDGKTYPELTYFYSPRGETAAFSAEDEVEVHLVELPRLG